MAPGCSEFGAPPIGGLQLTKNKEISKKKRLDLVCKQKSGCLYKGFVGVSSVGSHPQDDGAHRAVPGHAVQ